MVVGIGNSAVDIACELSHHCSQVYLSTRRGAWVYSRMGSGGTPIDMQFNRFLNCIPKSYVKGALEGEVNKRFNHEKYGLAATHDIFAGHPTISDELPGLNTDSINYLYRHFDLHHTKYRTT